MKFSKGVIISIFTIFGVGIPASIVVTHSLTKVSIWDMVKNDADEEQDEKWDTLHAVLSNIQNPKTQGLKQLKQHPNKDELKKWCINSYSQTYTSWIQPKKDNLLEDVKSACILKNRK